MAFGLDLLAGGGSFIKKNTRGLKNFFGGGGTTSQLQTQQFPGIFGVGGESTELAEMIKKLSGDVQTSPLQDMLTGELTDPTFEPTTASDQALIDAIMSQTQGASAVRGLGPATQGSLAQSIAPTLAGMRQQRIGNLIQGQAPDIQRTQQALAGLLELAGLSMPQIVGGQATTQRGPGLGAMLLQGIAQGLASKKT